MPSPAAEEKPDNPARTALGLVGVAAVALALLWRPLAVFDTVLWGPESPWSHRDFLGAWWLFWASAHPGDELALQSWPDGALPLQHHVPNPFDAWLLGPVVAAVAFPLWWNLLQLFHHLGNVLAATWLCRRFGARAGSSFAAGCLVAASPVLLHEVAGGRTLSGAAWPGLLALGLLLRSRGGLRPDWHGAAAGLLIGLQGLFYLYTGLLFGLVALLLRPGLGLLAAALPLAPYLWWLLPAWSDAQARPPPAGFSSLPVAGLLGLSEVRERFRLHPALWVGGATVVLGLLAGWQRRRPRGLRLLLALGLVGVVALGPLPTWNGGETLFVSPMAWVGHLVPTLGRLHHPVRAAFLLVPLLAVGLTVLLDRLPAPVAVAVGLLALPMHHAVQLAAPWEPPGEPPGAEAARWLAAHASDSETRGEVGTGGESGGEVGSEVGGGSAHEVGAIVDLTGFHGDALSLQPLHGRPMLEGLRKEQPVPQRQSGRLRAGVDPWLAGQPVSGDTLAALRAAGFTHVLVVDRGGYGAAGPEVFAAVQAQLGTPVVAGLYAL